MTSLGRFSNNLIDGSLSRAHNKLRRRTAGLETRTGRDEGLAAASDLAAFDDEGMKGRRLRILTDANRDFISVDDEALHADADTIDINWYLPLNLASDAITDIRGLIYDGSEFIYVACRANTIGGQTFSNQYGVARYSLITRNWEVIGSMDAAVFCLAYYSGILYAGGAFTTINGASFSRIASWNGSAWSALGTGAAGGNVNALLSDGAGNIYATGAFTSMNAVANTARIAKWNGSAWSALSTGLASGAGSALALDGSSNLWIGGSFSGAGGVADTANIATWSGSAYSSVGVFNSTVLSFAYDSDKGIMYAGGDFTTIDSVNNTRISRYAAGSWSPLAGGLSNSVNAIIMDSDGLPVAGGLFLNVAGDAAVDYIAVFQEEEEWTGLSNAGGLDGGVNCLLLFPNGSIIVGGAFNTAGSIQCQSIAIYCKPLSEAIDIITSLFELYAPVASGYTATLTNTTNIAGSTFNGAYYQKIGNAVRVWGSVNVDPTAGSANTVLGFSLPPLFPSTFTNDWDLSGVGGVVISSAERAGVTISGDTTNNRATFAWFAPDGTDRTIRFEFSYIIH